MGKPRINLSGKKFGYLTIIEHVEHRYTQSGKAIARVKCKCECGKIVIKDTQNVKRGTLSCGCKTKELKSNNGTHCMSKTRLYHTWVRIKSRCYYEQNNRFYKYGARGITVCKEWLHNFQVFYKWAIDNGYRDDLTIDRIDVNGNYEPSNCRWVDNCVQARNKTNTIIVNYNGVDYCLKELCRILKLPYKTVWQRCHVLNWNIDKAINTPIRKLKR